MPVKYKIPLYKINMLAESLQQCPLHLVHFAEKGSVYLRKHLDFIVF